MAVTCDLCGKRDGGRNRAGLYAITYASKIPGLGISVTFSLLDGDRYIQAGQAAMVCGNCLEKMHIFDIANENDRRQEEYERRKAVAAQTIDVTPRQIGERRLRLLGSGE